MDVEELTTLDLNLSPNPSSGFFVLKFGSLPSEAILVEIVDVSGKVVLSNVFSPTQLMEINLSEKANGIYLMNVSVGEKKAFLRMVKFN